VAAERDIRRLGLGTVQFGLNYGVANRAGKPSRDAAKAVLERAFAAGLDLLDTAPSYGDSEEVLGATIDPGRKLRIVTKTPVFGAESIGPEDGAALTASVEASLRHLNASSLHGVLVHHGHNLLKPGGHHLWAALKALKDRGLVLKIGYSAYSPDEIERIQNLFPADIVQTPLNVLDQRLITSGTLARLKSADVEVHTRSVFLQGLLLMPPEAIPAPLGHYRAHLAGLRDWFAARGIRPLSGCLGFVLGRASIDAAIVGVQDIGQFDEISAALSAMPDADFGEWASEDDAILNPARWQAN
jgi:aryl-alcohol dehydrogenase-like predicted oxidoreductase